MNWSNTSPRNEFRGELLRKHNGFKDFQKRT
jgi:hypothetical protein